MMQNSLVTLKGSAGTGVSSLLSKLPNFLAGLIIFFSATQLGLHFWPLSSLVYGIRIDYLAPTLYFLDILIILYLVMRRILDRRPEQSSSRDIEGGRSLLMGMPILLVNLLYSANPLATLSWSLHFLLYYLFLAILLRPLGSDLLRKSWPSAKMFSRTTKTSSETRSDPQDIVVLALTLSLLFQTCLSFGQVSLGHSLGGLLYYLGERMVSVGSPGIALASFMDHVVLRAYGTFSHPNILAGYAVISLLIILRLSPRTPGSDLLRKSWPSAKMFSRSALGGETRSDPQRKFENWRIWDMRLLLPLSLTTLLVILTQSRSAAISLFALIIPTYLITKTKLRTLFFYFALCVTVSLVTGSLTPTRSDLSSSQRHTLQGLSLSVIKGYPIFGTGAQASISTYPLIDSSIRLLQPDHNSFTLFISWFGVFGLLAILYLLRVQFENWRIYDLRFLVLLPLLLLDHYLLTSPQGLFVLLVYLKLTSNYQYFT